MWRHGGCLSLRVLPSLTSAFSVSSTFWPLMSLWMTLCWWRWVRPWRKKKTLWKQKKSRSKSAPVSVNNYSSHPQDLSADVGDPLLLQRVAFGVFDQVCDWTSTTELHHQLQTFTESKKKNRQKVDQHRHQVVQKCYALIYIITKSNDLRSCTDVLIQCFLTTVEASLFTLPQTAVTCTVVYWLIIKLMLAHLLG